jgi:hypothetical protein
MAVQSKAEINLRRLLAQCETMANEIKLNDGRINWRLEKVSYFQYKRLENGSILFIIHCIRI